MELEPESEDGLFTGRRIELSAASDVQYRSRKMLCRCLGMPELSVCATAYYRFRNLIER